MAIGHGPRRDLFETRTSLTFLLVNHTPIYDSSPTLDARFVFVLYFLLFGRRMTLGPDRRFDILVYDRPGAREDKKR